MTRWLIAIIITLASVYYQRTTGPTYPLQGAFAFDGQTSHFRLERSHSSTSDQPVTIPVADSSVTGAVVWRRYPTNESWQTAIMQRSGATLTAALPRQPPAGKLEYAVILKKQEREIRLPQKGAVVTRFKGEVPGHLLIPHIVLMFLALLLSTRAGLEALGKESRPRIYVWATVVALFTGGMILGSIVQKYAFGTYWTGIPFGVDVTDNKTLIALLGWVAAAIAVEKNRSNKIGVLGAAILMLAVYAIPHSLFGSELKY
jgi:hypothetical protein